MKDKRQRIAVAWPYAAVYSDPAFAASILQAAANSVGMPYGYPPNPMIPQMPVMAPQMQSNFGYGYRYSPYPMPQRTQPIQSPPSYPLLSQLPPSYPTMRNQSPHHDIHSPASPSSNQSLSPGSDKNDIPIKCIMNQTQSTMSSPSRTIVEKPKLFQPYKSEAEV